MCKCVRVKANMVYVFQERMKEELKKRHKQERDSLATKLDHDAQREEEELKKHANSETEQLLREKKNRNAAELAARSDLSQDQLAEVSGQSVKRGGRGDGEGSRRGSGCRSGEDERNCCVILSRLCFWVGGGMEACFLWIYILYSFVSLLALTEIGQL